MSFIVVNVIGILFITGIIYWFWLFKSKAISYAESSIIDIIVDGGTYSPNIIRAKHNKPAHLKFLRKDPSPCAEWVIFDKLNISQELPIDQAITLTLSNEEQGEFEFTCQMGMYRGKLIVE